ncbi:MAG: DUF2313 domain-containing protein [Lachnospiraceae bacterium]|nr:DUF2313 domain-containing protein [Lachnospiraceae bacterium]
MDNEKINLSEYLPEYFRQFKDIEQVMDTESIELQNIRASHRTIKDNRFIIDCNEDGLNRYEKILGITPKGNETKEKRRFRLLVRWNTAMPYNFVYLLKQLDMLCGGLGYRASMDFKNQTLAVKVELVSKSMVDSVAAMLDAVLPCNILYSVELLYNQHKTLSPFTHGELKRYTHKELREEVLEHV